MMVVAHARHAAAPDQWPGSVVSIFFNNGPSESWRRHLLLRSILIRINKSTLRRCKLVSLNFSGMGATRNVDMNGASNVIEGAGVAAERDPGGTSCDVLAAFDISDDALERAASIAEGRAVTIGYCTHWYACGWPL